MYFGFEFIVLDHKEVSDINFTVYSTNYVNRKEMLIETYYDE